MRLWNDWGLDRPKGVIQRNKRTANKEEEERKIKESGWRRAWVLAQSRKAVRRWIEGLEKA